MIDSAVSTAPSRLLYTAGVRRSRYFRLLLRAMLGVLASLVLGVILVLAADRGLLPPWIAGVGQLLAFAFGVWFVFRAVVHLVHFITRRSVTVRLYDKGFVWYEHGHVDKHRWAEIVRFRMGARALGLFGYPLLDWGAQVLTVEDGSEYRFTPAMGDVEVFAQYVRPYSARVTSLRMGKALRADQPVKLSERVTVYPGGVAVGKAEVPWAELRVTVDPGWKKITLRRVQPGSKPRVLARIGVGAIDNPGGFVEIARPQIESHSQRLE
jgi:hypothetical protein